MEDKFRILRNAERFVVNRQFDKAVSEYQAIVDTHGDDPSILNTLGDLLLRVNRRSEAFDCFLRVAEAFTQSGFVAKAIATYRKLETLNPGNRDVLFQLSELYLRRGLKFEALKCTRHLAQLLRGSSDTQGLILACRRITELEPRNPESFVDLGEALETTNPADAATAFLAAARLCFERSEFVEARDLSARVRVLDPGNPSAGPLLARAEALIPEAVAPEPEVAEQAPPPLEPDELLQEPAPPESMEEVAPAEPVVVTEEAPLPPESEELPQEPAPSKFAEEVAPPQPLSEVSDLPASCEETPAEPLPDAPGFDEAGFFEEVEVPATPSAETPDPIPGVATAPPGEAPRQGIGPVEEALDLEALGESPGLEAETSDGFWEPDTELPVDRPVFPEAPQADPQYDEVRELLKEADFYMRVDLREDASRLLRELLERFPEDHRVLDFASKIGLGTQLASEPELAAEEPKSDSGDPESLDAELDSALDDLFFDEPDDLELLEHTAGFHESVQTEPRNDRRAQYDLGVAYREMGMLEDAAAKFERAYLLFSDAAEPERALLCSTMLVNTYLKMGNFAKTVEWADVGLSLPNTVGPSRYGLEYDRALALSEMGEMEESLAGFRRVLEAAPDFRDTRERVARLSPAAD